MKCLILAAGYATRLYPLTKDFPKPLLEVGGKTILDWLTDDMDKSGKIDEYIVISNHRFAHHFEKWAQTKQMKITVVDDGTETNGTRLGAVCDIKFAMDRCAADDDIFVIAGDNVLDFSLTKFIDYAGKKGTSCIMRYFEPDAEKLKKCGVLEISPDDRVLSMEEKPDEPKSHWCCPPFYYYTKADAALISRGIESGCGTDAPGSFAAWLAQRSAVHAMEMPGSRYDIGSTESYEKVCSEYKGIK